MKITLHDESIDVEVGQKVVFYEYFLNNTNELEVKIDETCVDVIDKENNVIGFKNGDHVSTLQFYQRDFLGERFFLSDSKENRLRYLRSRIEYCEKKQKAIDADIEDIYKSIYKSLNHRMRDKEEAKTESDLMKKLIEQVEGE